MDARLVHDSQTATAGRAGELAGDEAQGVLVAAQLRRGKYGHVLLKTRTTHYAATHHAETLCLGWVATKEVHKVKIRKHAMSKYSK